MHDPDHIDIGSLLRLHFLMLSLIFRPLDMESLPSSGPGTFVVPGAWKSRAT